MESKNSEDFLIHYGVKGMKWGVRKDSKASRPRKPRKESATERIRRNALARRRTLKSSDLDMLVKRLESEKRLKTLLNEDLNPGRAFVNETLRKVGPKLATAVVTGAGMYVVRGVLTKEWGLSDLAKNIPKVK